MVCEVIDGASAGRRGLLVIFAADGALFASWASRLPQVQDNIHADAAGLGFALAGTAVGALSAMPITGVVCHHRAPYRVACVTLLALCLSMVLPATCRFTAVPWVSAAGLRRLLRRDRRRDEFGRRRAVGGD
jgi:hypothetical protein